MPQRKSGLKELRVSEKRRMHNLDIKTDLKKTIKKFKASIAAKNFDDANSLLNTVYKKLDKAAKRRLLEKNTASRRKSQFSKKLATIKQ